MKTPKSKDLDRCMETVLDHCKESNMWSGDSLHDFCTVYIQRASLSALASKGYIKLITVKGLSVVSVFLLDSGYNYFAEKEAERKKFIKNFFSNFITGFLSGVFVSVVGGLILNRLI